MTPDSVTSPAGPPRLERILVGLDGSSDAHAAAVLAAELARRLDIEVVGVHAVVLLESWVGDESGPVAARQRAITAMTSIWARPLIDAGVRHRLEVFDGSPVDVIIDAARDHDVDLIVLGSRGVGALPEKLMGSTSTQVAQRAQRPVLIVPGAHIATTGA